MAKKTARPSTPPKKANLKALHVKQQPTETPANALAHTSLRPTVQAALTLMNYNKEFGEMSINTLVADLGKLCELANNGDLARAEASLTAQAHTLDAIFNNLARRAINAEYMKNLECYLKLALRAQSQCRATWETLATIKNPPLPGYVNQANIAHGPQQVNNATTPETKAPRARENENLQNELLEHKDGERLDFGAARETSGADPAMATLGEIDRSPDPRREG